MHLSTGEHEARWLLAESSWADLFTPPRFLGVARWIWKVSTCLLVLQFLPHSRTFRVHQATGPARTIGPNCGKAGSRIGQLDVSP
jgi:hypothetical protein